MTRLRWIAVGYTIVLAAAAALNYVPGLTDEQGRSFGIFALDIFDDALHVVSASWAAAAAWTSHRASKLFLRYFGLLYFVDGVMGLFVGSGYLDIGIVHYGIQRPAADVQDPREHAAHRTRRIRAAGLVLPRPASRRMRAPVARRQGGRWPRCWPLAVVLRRRSATWSWRAAADGRAAA